MYFIQTVLDYEVVSFIYELSCVTSSFVIYICVKFVIMLALQFTYIYNASIMCFTLRKAHAGGGGTFQEVEIIVILGTPHPSLQKNARPNLATTLSELPLWGPLVWDCLSPPTNWGLYPTKKYFLFFFSSFVVVIGWELVHNLIFPISYSFFPLLLLL